MSDADLCQWETVGFCCGDGSPTRGDCFRLSGCGCKAEPHRAHYRSFDGRPHPNDRQENPDG